MNQIKPDLDKGQHLLIDKEILTEEIKVADIDKEDKILEIGAGAGVLTKELAKKAKEVLAFEIDSRFKKDLRKLEEKYPHLKIIYNDAFNYSWKGYSKIVSNIPYFVSEQLINKMIKDDIPESILIVGENFKNILEENKTKIGIIANLFYNIEFIMEVDKISFSPIPRVDSWLIKMHKKKEITKSEKLLRNILTKQGKIKNAIIYSLVEEGMTKKESKKIIEKFNLSGLLDKSIKTITRKTLLELKENLKNFFH